MTEKRIGVIGAGVIGRTHIDTIARTDGYRLTALVDPSPAATALADQHGARLFGSVEDLIAAKEIDAAVVASPTETHVTLTTPLLEAGLPVLLEKPVAADLESSCRLLATMARSGTPLLIGHHRRHNPIIKAAKRAIVEGALGDLRFASATSALMKPADYFEAGVWRKTAGAGGPLLINLIHEIDLLRHFFGEVRTVSAMISSDARGFEVEDAAVAILRFDRGGMASLAQSDAAVGPWAWDLTSGENLARFPAHDISAHVYSGSEGGLSLPDLTLWRHAGEKTWLNELKRQRLPHATGDAYVAQLEQFGAVIDGRAAPLVSGVDGAKNLAVVEAIKRAGASGAETPVENARVDAAVAGRA